MNVEIYECKTASSQTYQFVMFVRNAKRVAKVPFSIREIGCNSFRWTEPFSVILQICPLSVSFSLEGEGQDEGVIFRVNGPHPHPLPQAGEGTDSMLALNDSAKLFTSSRSERHGS